MMRLGRLPHDPAALAAVPVHRFGAVPPPPALDRRGVEFAPELYGNDTLPDCTAAALSNAARAVAALNGYGLVVYPEMVPLFYSSCVGYPVNLAATDGAVVLDVLRRQMIEGFDIGPQVLSGEFGTLDPASRSGLATGLAHLGPVYLGVTLRDREMQGGAVWDVLPGRDDGPIVGGHAVIGWDYAGLGDGDTVRIGTWGRWQDVTWRWLAARLDEAHGLVWRQLARTDGTFYAGVTLDRLQADLAA